MAIMGDVACMAASINAAYSRTSISGFSSLHFISQVLPGEVHDKRYRYKEFIQAL